MLPPHELRGKEFSHTIRGYSTAEVDEHIAFILEKYTELYRVNDALEQELQQTKDRLAELEVNSDAIRRAMVNAQREEHKIISEAERRADLIMRTAKSNCDRVLVDFRRKIREERLTLHKLRESVAEFRENALKQFTMSIRYIEELAPKRDSEPEWEKTEEEYAAELLEQMKLDIAASADNSYTEEVSDTSAVPSEKETEAGESSGNAPEKKKAERKGPIRRPARKAQTEQVFDIPASDGVSRPEELASLAELVGLIGKDEPADNAESPEGSESAADGVSPGEAQSADTRTFDALPAKKKKTKEKS